MTPEYILVRTHLVSGSTFAWPCESLEDAKDRFQIEKNNIEEYYKTYHNNFDITENQAGNIVEIKVHHQNHEDTITLAYSQIMYPTAPYRATLSQKKPKNIVPKYNIIAAWSDADKCYITTVPALPGCMSDGPDLKTAVKNTRGIIREWIATAIKDGSPIPDSDGHDTTVMNTADELFAIIFPKNQKGVQP